MFHELEYKYRSDDVTLNAFLKSMESKKLSIVKTLDVASWDIYYTKPGVEDQFMRFRESPDFPELTKKSKIKESNNWQRIEVDLPLDPERITKTIVAKFVSMEDYEENFRIFKSCSIFFLNDINYVYYVVFDKNLKEIGRFIEVEVNKDRVLELGLEGAMTILKEGEKFLQDLGISPQNRLKKSLFELYRR